MDATYGLAKARTLSPTPPARRQLRNQSALLIPPRRYPSQLSHTIATGHGQPQENSDFLYQITRTLLYFHRNLRHYTPENEKSPAKSISTRGNHIIKEIHSLYLRQFSERLAEVTSPSSPAAEERHLKSRPEKIEAVKQAIYAPGRHVLIYCE